MGVGRGHKRRKVKVLSEGNVYLVQASAIVCMMAAFGWSIFALCIYGWDEPTVVCIPLVYIVINLGTLAHERFR